MKISQKMNHKLVVLSILFLNPFSSLVAEPLTPNAYTFKPIVSVTTITPELIIENHSYFGLNPYSKETFEAAGYIYHDDNICKLVTITFNENF